jgi:hypothetical protein
MEFELPNTQIGIILDNEDIVRGTILGTDDSKKNIKLLEECLGNEYGGFATLQKIEYFNHSSTFVCIIHIWDSEHTEGGPPDIYDFTIQKSILYHQIE